MWTLAPAVVAAAVALWAWRVGAEAPADPHKAWPELTREMKAVTDARSKRPW